MNLNNRRISDITDIYRTYIGHNPHIRSFTNGAKR